jgi:hypothetical protein
MLASGDAFLYTRIREQKVASRDAAARLRRHPHSDIAMSDGHPVSRKPWSGLLPSVALLLCSTFAALLVGLAPTAGQTQFAVIGAPWWTLAQTAELVGAAEGDILDFGGLPNVVIAHSDDPGFAAALYRKGAWLVLDPVLLRGCLGVMRGAV